MNKEVIFWTDTFDTLRHLEGLDKEAFAQLRDSYVLDTTNRVVMISDEQFRMTFPTMQKRNMQLLQPHLEQAGSQRELARALGVTTSHVSMIVSEKAAKKVTWKNVLCTVFLAQAPIEIWDLNHILMQLRRPGLWTDTHDPDVNRRNSVLVWLLEYWRGGGTHDRDSWLTFACEVLQYLGLEPIRRSRTPYEARFTPQERKLVDSWRKQLDEVMGCDYKACRRKYFSRYMAETGMTEDAAVNRLHSLTPFGSDTEKLRTFITHRSLNHNGKGSRENLVSLAIAMNCNLMEANEILHACNDYLLYPLREYEDLSAGENQELDWIKKLLDNGRRWGRPLKAGEG